MPAPVDPFRLPAMPRGWAPTRSPLAARWAREGRLTDADLRTHWLRENGYPGPAKDGYPVAEPRRAEVPGSWWIALDGHDEPCVWSPTMAHPERPDCVLRQRDVYPAVWAVFAAVLPDRGDCAECTATPCTDHYDPAEE